jgi:hypothetical protein
MPQFDSDNHGPRSPLFARVEPNGETIEVHELVKIEWPSPDGTIYYAVHQTDEVASVAPPRFADRVTRILPENHAELVRSCRDRCDHWR